MPHPSIHRVCPANAFPPALSQAKFEHVVESRLLHCFAEIVQMLLGIFPLTKPKSVSPPLFASLLVLGYQHPPRAFFFSPFFLFLLFCSPSLSLCGFARCCFSTCFFFFFLVLFGSFLLSCLLTRVFICTALLPSSTPPSIALKTPVLPCGEFFNQAKAFHHLHLFFCGCVSSSAGLFVCFFALSKLAPPPFFFLYSVFGWWFFHPVSPPGYAWSCSMKLFVVNSFIGHAFRFPSLKTKNSQQLLTPPPPSLNPTCFLLAPASLFSSPHLLFIFERTDNL